MTYDAIFGHKPSIDDVIFDDSRYHKLNPRQSKDKRQWQTGDGDEIGIYYISMPPDLPRSNSTKISYTQYFQFFEGAHINVIECYVMLVSMCPSVLSIYNMPQKDEGITYVGTILIPFENFSYIVKCQCEENSDLGTREDVLVKRGIQKSKIYDIEYDLEFPSHPLTRARSIVSHVVSSLRISMDTIMLPKFLLAPTKA